MKMFVKQDHGCQPYMIGTSNFAGWDRIAALVSIVGEHGDPGQASQRNYEHQTDDVQENTAGNIVIYLNCQYGLYSIVSIAV